MWLVCKMVQNISVPQTTIIVGVLTTAIVLGTYYYNKLKKNRIPTEWKPVGKIKELHMYPLKSGKRNEVNEAECTNRGLIEKDEFNGTIRLRDRCFVVYKPENLEYRTARVLPKLVLISVKSYDAHSAIFQAPDMPPLIVEIPSPEYDNVVKINHFQNEVIHSRDCGDEAAAWFSTFLQGKDSGLRLACHDGIFKRKIKEMYGSYFKQELRNESAGLNSDLAAVLLLNEASANDICDKVGNSEICANNFRSNIIVSDPNLKPYAEDQWKWIKIGDVVMRNVGNCIRCIMTTINQENGVRGKDNEPLKSLTKYRGIGPGNTPIMGIYLDIYQTGVISVGDTVYVSE